MGYFQPGVATGCFISLRLWLSSYKMEGILISTLFLDAKASGLTLSHNQLSQTQTVCLGSLLTRGKALSAIKKNGGEGQVILPPITEVMVSLGGEDIHMSNRSDNVRLRVQSKTVRRLSPSSVWLIAKWMTPVIGARIRCKRREDLLHTYCSRAVKTTSGSPSTHWHTPQRLLLGAGNAKA